MATLSELVQAGVLVLIDPLEDHELPVRRLYGTPEFIKWLDEVLPDYPEERAYAQLIPIQQVYAVFSDYVLGRVFSSDERFKKLNYTPDLNVWEIKTTSIRIFGWVPAKDAFICCYGDLADTVKLMNQYETYQAKTFRIMREIALDEPKWITSGRYEDVISNEN